MRSALFALCILVSAGLGTRAQAQFPQPLPDPSLDLRAAAAGRTLVLTPDGGAVISHDGRWAGGIIERTRLFRMAPDGSVDPNWTVLPNGTVWAMELVGDELYLAGSFSNINGTPRRGLARVSLASGALSGWDPNNGSNTMYRFDTILAVGDDLYVGGGFTQIGTATRSHLAKIDRITGQLAASFAPTITSTSGVPVNALASDGTSLYVGGLFTQVNSTARSNAAKLGLGDGLLDPTWSSSFNGQVIRFALDGGSLYAIGCFSQVNGTARSFLARVSTAGVGTLDATWNPAPNQGCNYGLHVDANAVYVAGAFTQIGGAAAQRVGRLSKTGTGALDTSWQPTTEGGVFVFNARPTGNGQVFLQGEFVNINGSYTPGNARVNDIDASLLSGNIYSENRAQIAAIVDSPDGGIYAGGNFTRVGNVFQRGVLRISPNGQLDASWTPELGRQSRAFALVRDAAHVYVGGDFALRQNPSVSNLVRISHGGAIDSTWAPNPSQGVVFALALDEVGNTLLVGGTFLSLGGQSRNRIGEVIRTTALATAFNPNAQGTVNAIALDGNDVFVGGDFTSIGGQPRMRLAKVNRSGAVDPTFVADANGTVRSILLGPNSTLYVGGAFQNLAGPGRLVRLLRATGSAEPAWNTFPDLTVFALAPAADGFYVGGSFTSIAGEPRGQLARLSHDGTLASNFAPAGANLTQLSAIIEQGAKVTVGGSVNFFEPTNATRTGLAAFPREGVAPNGVTCSGFEATPCVPIP